MPCISARGENVIQIPLADTAGGVLYMRGPAPVTPYSPIVTLSVSHDGSSGGVKCGTPPHHRYTKEGRNTPPLLELPTCGVSSVQMSRRSAPFTSRISSNAEAFVFRYAEKPETSRDSYRPSRRYTLAFRPPSFPSYGEAVKPLQMPPRVRRHLRSSFPLCAEAHKFACGENGNLASYVSRTCNTSPT